MAFTQTARDYVAQPDKRIFYTLEVRGFHDENAQWARLSLTREGFTLTDDRAELASSLEFTAPAGNALHFGETDPANPLALFSEARLTCEMAGESEALFLGFITEICEDGALLRCFARGHAAKLARAACEVELEGECTGELAQSPLIALANEYDNHTFGLDPRLEARRHPRACKRRGTSARLLPRVSVQRRRALPRPDARIAERDRRALLH
jgi:hypothetical protein